MQEKLVTFETAKLAKEVGFSIKDNYLYKWYDELGKLHQWMYLQTDESVEFVAPTQSLLQKWLREVHGIHIAILPKTLLPSNEIKYYCFKGRLKRDFKDLYNTYEEALEARLQEALKLIKED